MFNFDAREVSAMAWNGSNGLYGGQPGYLPYTAWHNTRPETAIIDSIVMGLRGSEKHIAAMKVFARADSNSPWVTVGAPVAASRFQHSDAGIGVTLAWPQSLRAKKTIVSELKIVIAFNPGTKSVRLDRVALYPRASTFQ
jgi:hypothetical protein